MDGGSAEVCREQTRPAAMLMAGVPLLSGTNSACRHVNGGSAVVVGNKLGLPPWTVGVPLLSGTNSACRGAQWKM